MASRVGPDVLDKRKSLTPTGNLTKVTRFPALGLVSLHSELSRLWYVICIYVIIYYVVKVIPLQARCGPEGG